MKPTGFLVKILFGGEDNSEAINVLKQNVATLMANDELHEKHLKDKLKSQQINAGEIKINRDLLRQVKKEMAQINVTLNKITFKTQMLFSMASFQVSTSQLRHRVSIIRDALFGLQINLDILYHHYSVMVDNKLTPEMISPKNLYDILQDVQNEIRDHPDCPYWKNFPKIQSIDWGTPCQPDGVPPRNVNRHTPVKTVPSPFLWNGGGNNLPLKNIILCVPTHLIHVFYHPHLVYLVEFNISENHHQEI